MGSKVLHSSSEYAKDPLSVTTLSHPSFAYPIVRDGNCLFRALSYGIYGIQEEHALVRNRIVNHIANHWSYYSSLAIGNTFYGIPIKSANDYTNHMKKDGMHGGHLELTVASNIFSIFINLHHSNENKILRFGSEGGRKKRVTLLYTGDGAHGHYDAIVIDKKQWNRIRNRENNKRYRAKRKANFVCSAKKLDHVVYKGIDKREIKESTKECSKVEESFGSTPGPETTIVVQTVFKQELEEDNILENTPQDYNNETNNGYSSQESVTEESARSTTSHPTPPPSFPLLTSSPALHTDGKEGSITGLSDCAEDAEDEFDCILKTWKRKLKRMSSLQKLFAEKLVNDVLFEGELGTLNRGSVLTVEPK